MSRSYPPADSKNPESFYRDILADQVGGATEVPVPFGRADVVTESIVYEVEPVIHWRDGVRQVLAYAAQFGLRPALALYGKPSIALKIWQELQRVPPPGLELWWLSGDAFVHVADAALADGLQATVPPKAERSETRPNAASDADRAGLLTLAEIAAKYGRPLKAVRNWSCGPGWPEPAGMGGRSYLYRAAEIDVFVRSLLQRDVDIPGDPDELLDTRTAAAAANISWGSLRSYINRGTWPEPDDVQFGVRRWKRSTVRAAMASRKPRNRRSTGTGCA